MDKSVDPQARILIVDDELGMREGSRRVLTPLYHTVDTADSIATALEAIRSKNYDLVLLDVMMPDGSGLDLCDPIHERDADAICIVITGYATIELAVDAVKRGAYDFLSKPFTSDQLIVAVKQGLERRRLRLETADLDACRRRADELARANSEIEELERTKSQFMLMVAHELRAPVAAVQSYVNLILTGYVSGQELHDTMTRVHHRLEELLDLITDLLELAHLKQAKDAPSPILSPQPVADILEEVVGLVREQAQHKNQDLDVQILARPMLTATHDHIRQIWMNLINNAIKYTPAGGHVKVRLEANEQGITGSVTDTGIGIAETDLPHLFREFFRTDQAKATGETGTGLGLAILKQITDSYGGTIAVQSRLGHGTCITFTLPFKQAQAALLPAVQSPGLDGSHTRVSGSADDPPFGTTQTS
jgi:two-component system sensor histidine kinase/response regulator